MALISRGTIAAMESVERVRPRGLKTPSLAGFPVRRVIVLLALALGGLLVYAALVLRYPLETYIAVPRANIGSLDGRNPRSAFLLASAGLLLHALYVGAVLLCWWWRPSLKLSSLVWGYALAAGTVLTLIWPVTSTDVFDYIFRGRMASHFGVNPYTTLPNRFKSDPLFTYIGWPNAPSAYGPLWELMSARMAALGGTSVWRNVLLHKALALITFLLCGWVINRIVRERSTHEQLLASMIWLWSPLALWEIPAVGHNDGLLVLSLLLAVWAIMRDSYRWATIALVVGALFKFLPAIMLPLIAAYVLRSRTTWPARIGALVEMGVITVTLVVLAYLPYWEGRHTLTNIALREKFLNAAPLAVVTHALSQWYSVDVVRPMVSRVGSALLATGILWQMWRIWRHGREMRTAFFGLLTWYLVIASQWFQPWYVLWLLALLALRPSRSTFGWVAVWALSGQASYLLQYFILAWLRWPGNQLNAQILYLLLIFIPPLIVWIIGQLVVRAYPRGIRSPEPSLATS